MPASKLWAKEAVDVFIDEILETQLEELVAAATRSDHLTSAIDRTQKILIRLQRIGSTNASVEATLQLLQVALNEKKRDV